MSEFPADEKALIDDEIQSHGFPALAYEEDPESSGEFRANLGRFEVSQEDEDQFLFEGEQGILFASVVGAEKYHNQRVAFFFQADGTDMGDEIVDLGLIRPI